jgi:hypothetical protein
MVSFLFHNNPLLVEFGFYRFIEVITRNREAKLV